MSEPPHRAYGAHSAVQSLVVILLAFSIGTATARANPPYTVSATPAKLVAGSSLSVLTFQFSAVNAAKGWNTVQVPAVASGSAWSAPQSSNPADPGFVAVSNQTCSSASLSSITGTAGGPWTILVNATCAKNGRFAIRYGAGPSPVAVATNAGSYVFHATRVITQPVVNVIAGPAATLGVTGLADAAAGTPQSPTVTATDAYGNTATRYRGTVHFTGSGDPPFASLFFVVGWDVPADYTFTDGDAGTHTFAATANFAGAQTLTAADTRPSSITGLQTITISPGPAAYVTASFQSDGGSVIPGQTIRLTFDAEALDAYGNIATADNLPLNVAITKSRVRTVTGASLCCVVSRERHTDLQVDVPVVSTQVQVSVDARHGLNRPGMTDAGSIGLLYGVPPDLDAVSLDWDPVTQNPDGTYNGFLKVKDPNSQNVVQLDPNSLVATGGSTVNADGTTTVPASALTLANGPINVIMTFSTPTDPATGELQGTPAVTAGTQIQVLGCQAQAEQFGVLTSPATAAGRPARCRPVRMERTTP